MNTNAISNFEIVGLEIVRPATERFGRILTEAKTLGTVEQARTSAIRLFDSFGEKNLIIVSTTFISDILEDETLKLYQFQKLENDEYLLTFNFLKSNATPAMIASAEKFHEIALSELATSLS